MEHRLAVTPPAAAAGLPFKETGLQQAVAAAPDGLIADGIEKATVNAGRQGACKHPPHALQHGPARPGVPVAGPLRLRLAMRPHATDTCGPGLLRACAPRARGATVLNCLRVFARSGVTAAFGRFAGHGVRTAVGTDGYNMDLPGELNAASMISKIAAGLPGVATAPELIDAVTAAAAIRRLDLGVIEPGAAADLTVVDMSHPHLQPMADPRRGLIALANRANIEHVVVDGRVLIADGRYAGGDEAAITAAINRIWALPEAQAAFSG